MKVNPASELTEDQVATLRIKLLDARRTIASRAGQRRPPQAGDPLETGDPAGDAADQAELSFEQGLGVRLGETDRMQLQEIDDALARMDQGTYGVCEATGEPIGLPRLSAAPWARYTTEYQEKLEAATGTSHPPRL
jgi:DnaK suppressor protein